MKSLAMEKSSNLAPKLFEVWNEFGGNAAGGHGALDRDAVVNRRFEALHFEASLVGGLGADVWPATRAFGKIFDRRNSEGSGS